MNASPGLAEGTVLGGRYRVERPLGQGGMGAVYLVRHVRTGEALALKLMHASFAADGQALERFRREAQAPAQIDSDHVARVFDADVAPEIGGAPFLVMELLRGRDLDQELSARGRLGPAEVLEYLGQASRALDKAHRIGIVHRDLKPENLFLTQREDGTACLKVVDFGIARVGAGAQDLQTATGEVLGTPRYMAPEQLFGTQAQICPATDVWALGLIAFRLLTGQNYWRFQSLAELALLVTSQPMTPPSALDPGLGAGFDAWFLRCCMRDPAQRFGSAGEAVAALGTALGGSLPPPRPDAYAPTAFGPGTASLRGPAQAQTGQPYGPGPSLAPTQGMTSGPSPTTRPAPEKGTRNAVLLVAAVLTLGFGALVVAIVLVVLPSSSPSPAPSAPKASAPLAGDGCHVACAKLAECTGVGDPMCEANCHKSPSFASCGARQGCPAISACALGQSCGGREPQGTLSCRATTDCEGQCLNRGGDPTACLCACARLLAPDRATELAANNECGAVHCAEACRPPVNGNTCLRCFAASCGAESNACRAR